MNMNYYNELTRSEILYCLMCQDAPCDKVCPHALPGKTLQSIWLSNSRAAAAALPDDNPCKDCDAPCEKVCVRPGKVSIKRSLTKLCEEIKPSLEISQPSDEGLLRTEICGVPLENPFLLSSSVVASTYEMCARAFEAGWAGAAFKTICSFDIHEASPRFSAIKGAGGDITGFKNIEQLSNHSVAENMEIFRRLKAKYPAKVIIASIMGKDAEEWGELAKLCEENGADVIELNLSCPNMSEEGYGSDIGHVPALVEEYTRIAKENCHLPVLAKLTPNVESVIPQTEAAIRGGADGVAAINTIKSITGVNIHTYVAAPSVAGKSASGGYSGNAVKPVALRFVTEIAQDIKYKNLHISAMGGIETWRDALEFILLGAGSVQVTTSVMQYGYRIIDDLKSGLNYYMAEKGFRSLDDVRGLALETVSDTTNELERDTVLFPSFNHDKCIGCGRCYISCMDGGHQAIVFGKDRRPKLDGSKCVGCHLCILVCHEDAIRPAKKRVRKH